jgi:hypothetical protein
MAKERTGTGSLDAGWGALGKGDRAGARARFEDALAIGATPEALI